MIDTLVSVTIRISSQRR